MSTRKHKSTTRLMKKRVSRSETERSSRKVTSNGVTTDTKLSAISMIISQTGIKGELRGSMTNPVCAAAFAASCRCSPKDLRFARIEPNVVCAVAGSKASTCAFIIVREAHHEAWRLTNEHILLPRFVLTGVCCLPLITSAASIASACTERCWSDSCTSRSEPWSRKIFRMLLPSSLGSIGAPSSSTCTRLRAPLFSEGFRRLLASLGPTFDDLNAVVATIFVPLVLDLVRLPFLFAPQKQEVQGSSSSKPRV
mmetsp:Transcript_59715/g.158423  ORF Transcript_59715/g.158423 Transcript_59715/m.158423 type:complete len:253 (-) Transcript_59715:64-822(-)